MANAKGCYLCEPNAVRQDDEWNEGCAACDREWFRHAMNKWPEDDIHIRYANIHLWAKPYWSGRSAG